MSQDLLDALARVLGPKGLVTDPADMAPHLVDWRNKFHGQARCVARPTSTEEVAQVVRLCAEHGAPVVPQGGNTSLCGGATPHPGGTEVVLSLQRMNRVREIDALDNTIVVESGVVLAEVQKVAEEAGRLFPLSLAAEGTAQIGGVLSTNAGGTAVLRYGNARDLVLGLEVVLPDGRIWNGLRKLRKDNTGYDLKHLFIGAEGTLGIITAAALKLYTQPRQVATALAAVPDAASAIKLLRKLQDDCGDIVTGFELFSRFALDLVLKHVPGVTDPMAEAHPWYVLIEMSTGAKASNASEALESSLGEGFEEGLAVDAVVASSEAQAAALWRIREEISESERKEGTSVKHDVSVAVSRMADFIENGLAVIADKFPDARVVAFGHVGDGNIHFNVLPAPGTPHAAVNKAVHDLTAAMDGSISAEHGLGQLKREEAKRYKAEVERDLMLTIKAALDARGLMNPGKML
ncbi:MAG TPA: FAD-binding oxidoreductase [Azospirillaceae bacterium]|nr:FAD-binding oxidoreductase [Azospirillaceae bacterium]